LSAKKPAAGSQQHNVHVCNKCTAVG